MRKTIFSFLLVASAAASSPTQEIETLDGRKIPHSAISSRDAQGVSIITDSGIERIAFTAMTAASQNALGYDPDAASRAAAAERQTAATSAARQKAAASLESMWRPWGERLAALDRILTTEVPSLAQRDAAEGANFRKLTEAKIEETKKKYVQTRALVEKLRAEGEDEESLDRLSRAILAGRIYIGMPRDGALLSWGAPGEVSESLGKYSNSETWRYRRGKYEWDFVTFDEGKVSFISQ